MPPIMLSDRRRYEAFFLFLQTEGSHHYPGDSMGGRCALRQESGVRWSSREENQAAESYLSRLIAPGIMIMALITVLVHSSLVEAFRTTADLPIWLTLPLR